MPIDIFPFGTYTLGRVQNGLHYAIVHQIFVFRCAGFPSFDRVRRLIELSRGLGRVGDPESKCALHALPE